MKVIMNYDENTGALTDKNGMTIINWINLQYEESSGSSIDILVKLKNSGFSTDEIIELKRKELI